MPGPPTLLISKRVQIGIIGLVAAGLAIGGFEAGRKSVNAAAVANSEVRAIVSRPADSVSEKTTLLERDHSSINVREIATVPFSELYDVLKAVSREQLLAWAADLEQMPRGPRQHAAVGAYFKTLVQVDHQAAIKAVLDAKNLLARDFAIEAMMKAAPESVWADLAEMTAQLQYPGRGFAQNDLIDNWSRVDPVSASKFVEKHRFSPGIKLPGEESDRVVLLLNNWGEIDPSAARQWLEADASRQTADGFRALLTSWGRVDRAAAIDYAIANEQRPNLQPAIGGLVYEFVRSAKEDANRLLLLLSPRQAKAALKNVADVTNPREIDPNVDKPPNYQRPPEEVARWMVTLPVDLWEESIGRVVQGWLVENADSAKVWFAQLAPEMRNVAIVSMCREAKPDYTGTDEVIELAFKISDKTVRDRALLEFSRSFSADNTEAIEVINHLPVSDAEKAYFRKLIMEEANGQ
ncbi:MAG: hypothetical protein WAO00_08050 [Chthoniobacterales bacterium]